MKVLGLWPMQVSHVLMHVKRDDAEVVSKVKVEIMLHCWKSLKMNADMKTMLLFLIWQVQDLRGRSFAMLRLDVRHSQKFCSSKANDRLVTEQLQMGREGFVSARNPKSMAIDVDAMRVLTER